MSIFAKHYNPTNNDNIKPTIKIKRYVIIDTFVYIKNLFSNNFEYFTLGIMQQINGRILKIKEINILSSQMFCV